MSVFLSQRDGREIVMSLILTPKALAFVSEIKHDRESISYPNDSNPIKALSINVVPDPT